MIWPEIRGVLVGLHSANSAAAIRRIGNGFTVGLFGAAIGLRPRTRPVLGRALRMRARAGCLPGGCRPPFPSSPPVANRHEIQ